MKIKKIQFPHPVLDNYNNDYVNKHLNVNFNIESKMQNYYFKVTFDTNSIALKKLIEKGKVKYLIHVECSSSFYREAFFSNDDIIEFKISTDLLRDKVEITSFIVADSKIDKFRTNEFNDIFRGYTFKINKGDILGIGDSCSFIADISLSKIKNISSIMTIKPNDDDKASAIEYDTTSNIITIYLPRKTFNQYKYLKQESSLISTLISMIVIPVLSEILNDLGFMDEEYSDKRWYRVIKKRLEDLDLEIEKDESKIKIAEKLIGDITCKAFNDLEKFEENIL